MYDRLYDFLITNNVLIKYLFYLKKAFDTLSHDTFLGKLEQYGIKGNNINWFNSYLLNRQKYIVLK